MQPQSREGAKRLSKLNLSHCTPRTGLRAAFVDLRDFVVSLISNADHEETKSAEETRRSKRQNEKFPLCAFASLRLHLKKRSHEFWSIWVSA
jgi:hypothetical protein